MATHSCILSMENCVDRGALWATVHGVAKEVDMTERALVCTHTHTHTHTTFRILVPEPRPLAVKAWSPNHWTAKEVTPTVSVFIGCHQTQPSSGASHHMPTPESPTAPSLAAGTLDIAGGFHRCQPVGRGLFNKGSLHSWLLMPSPMLPPVVLLKALSQPLPATAHPCSPLQNGTFLAGPAPSLKS